MTAHLLRNAQCVCLDPPSIESGDLRITGGHIVARGRTLVPEQTDVVLDCRGRLVMPGLVCAHTHLYSSLSRGMPFPVTPPASFPDRLRKIWWRLDRALDPETLRASAIAGALEALRQGVTTLVDHHASPNAIPGSLSTIADVLGEAGLRSVLCYETSDRDGMERRDQGLAENEEFLKTPRHLTRGLVGGHASFTLSDDSLRKMGEMAGHYGCGVHIHVAEDRSDVDKTQELTGRTIIDRFREAGIVRRGSVFAHCIHLREEEFAELQSAGVYLVHNPRSNMNNAVGHAPVALFGSRGALGTDGWGADMWEEARAGFLREEEAGGGRREPFDSAAQNAVSLRLTWEAGSVLGMLGLLAGGQRLAAEVFAMPIGKLDPGSVADLVVYDYDPATPLTNETLPAHLLFGLRSSMVESVMVDGNWVVRDRRCVNVDEHALLLECSEHAKKLWRKMRDISA